MTPGARGGDDLAARFADHVLRHGPLADASRIVIAVSGGMDSVVLLHLIRFTLPGEALDVTAAHFDHGMRGDSHRDADWVRGLAAAWEVPLRQERAETPVRGEAAAREARYGFLHRVRHAEGADLILTAHHADDQAETVLFRAVRGTGLAGLRGMPDRSPDGVVRPLLPFWRDELARYARARGLRWRDDPSNLDLAYARNALRRQILPELEASVARGARGALVRLARLAREDEAAWASVLPRLLDEVVLEDGPEGVTLDRAALLAHPPALRARLLRALVRRLGVVLDEAGTRASMEFTSRGSSGRSLVLPGGPRLTRDFGRLVLTASPLTSAGVASGQVPAEAVAEIGGPGSGSGTFAPADRTYRVEWAVEEGGVGGRTERFALVGLTFPLRFRGWAPGDRVRMAYGSKKLTKLFAERRVPAGEREGRAVLVDGRGRVLWVPGLARSVLAPCREGADTMIIGIEDADDV
ncbi:MAG TPA: tRNA lysidine(34) synthetase TilS [Longimicrobiales bacterium]